MKDFSVAQQGDDVFFGERVVGQHILFELFKGADQLLHARLAARKLHGMTARHDADIGVEVLYEL